MNLKQLNVLLADDDSDDCLFFKNALNELLISTLLTTVNDGEQLMEYLNCIAAVETHGRASLQIDDVQTHGRASLQNKKPDILFLDLNMPRKNGFECLSEIKKNEHLKSLPVIIFSTSFEQEVVNRLYANGAHYFIRKPAVFSQYKQIIQQSLALIALGHLAQPIREDFVLTLQNNFI